MPAIGVREDFRRDGLFINFLVDDSLMRLLAQSLPCSRINIGYPGICSEEYKMCNRIAHALQDISVETAVVGHARKIHLQKMASLIHGSRNSSANFWIPLSNYFITRTLAMPAEKVIEYAEDMLKYWKNDLSSSPIDVALTDCTNEGEDLSQRLKYFYDRLINAGARSIIVCDTLGKSNPKKLEILLKDLPDDSGNLEFHPHNDNGYALDNVKVAVSKGFTHIGTSVYGYGERGTMIDPREIARDYNIPFEQEKFNEFEQTYRTMIESLNEGKELPIIGKIVTGTHYRLLGRKEDQVLAFGVTSDKHILARMTGLDAKQIPDCLLQEMKNRLYRQRKRVLDGQCLTKLLKEVTSSL